MLGQTYWASVALMLVCWRAMGLHSGSDDEVTRLALALAAAHRQRNLKNLL